MNSLIALFTLAVIIPLSPLLADDASKNSSSGCECKLIHLVCAEPKEISRRCKGAVVACAQGCTLVVGSTECQDARLSSGDYTVAGLQAVMKRFLEGLAARVPQRLSTGYTADQRGELERVMRALESYSTLMHEIFHVCSSATEKLGVRAIACEEWGGKRIELMALAKSGSDLCAKIPVRNPDGTLNEFCASVCGQVYMIALYDRWTNCLCEASESKESSRLWLSAPECCRCYHDCRSGSMPDEVLQILPSFCKAEVYSDPKFKTQLEAQLQPGCKRMAFDPEQYSCSRLGSAEVEYERSCNK